MLDDNTSLKSIKSKLNKLVKSILDKAETDPDFKLELEQIFLDPNLSSTRSTGRKRNII